MNVSDPISDLLTHIRNGQRARKEVVSVPASRIKIGIAHILREEGFIKNYKCIRDDKQGVLKMALKYREDGDGVIRELQRISRPSRREYHRADDIPLVKRGYGVGIYSTSKGLMTDKDARRLRVGGEYMCTIF